VEVADTVGAGDAFAAAFMRGLDANRPLRDVARRGPARVPIPWCGALNRLFFLARIGSIMLRNPGHSRYPLPHRFWVTIQVTEG
jgi:hypothetical protein